MNEAAPGSLIMNAALKKTTFIWDWLIQKSGKGKEAAYTALQSHIQYTREEKRLQQLLVTALEKTILIWRWLAEHPGQSEADAYCVLDLSNDLCHCPLCESTRDKSRVHLQPIMRCRLCPLREFWPQGSCTAPTSVYMVWYVSDTDEQKTAAARAIADAAQRKLNEVSR